MDRARLRRWGIGLVVLGCLVGVRQCQRSYARVAPVHVDVLTHTAAKLCIIIASGRGLSAEGMAEYVYPARRGREFLAQYARYNSRPSYTKLEQLLDDYEALVRDTDKVRATDADWKLHLPELERRRDALFVIADQFGADLARE